MLTGSHKRITTGGGTPSTFTFYSATVFLKQVALLVSNAGTAWAIKVQDKSGTPSIVMSGTLSLPTDGFPVVLWFREAIRMEGGVDVITSGTTPGVVDVWVNVEDGK